MAAVRFQSAFTKAAKWGLSKRVALKSLGQCNPFSVRFQSAWICRSDIAVCTSLLRSDPQCGGGAMHRDPTCAGQNGLFSSGARLMMLPPTTEV